jgi:hypothetical protein
LPGNSKRATTYATIVDSSMVSTSAPATTITVLTKNCPIDAAPQARAKFEKSQRDGRLHGEANTSGLGLNAVIAAQINGSTDTSAHAARITWNDALAERSPARRGPRASEEDGAEAGGRTSVTVTPSTSQAQ